MKKLLLALLTMPMFVFGQVTTTIDFDTSAYWNAGGTVSGYGAHTYAQGLFSMSSANVFRETTATQDGFPGFHGTYAVRVRNASGSYAQFQIASGGVSTFNLNIRRWDGTPSPSMVLEYSTDGGSIWTSVDTVTNTTLNNQSDYQNFSGTINSSNTNILIQVRNLGTGTEERVMIDDFSWTDYTSSPTACGITNADLTSLTCNDNATPVTTDDYLTFSLNPTGANLGPNGYTISVSSGTVSPTSGTYGSATSFQLQDGSAGGGNVTITITDQDSTSCSFTATITDPGSCSSAIPVITLTPDTLSGFTHIVGTPSTEQTFTASGIALVDDITLTAPTGFEISLTTGTGFTNSLVLAQSAGSVANTTIYTRANSLTMGALAGYIVGTSSGADNDTVVVDGYADDYVSYTIDQINTIDANGVADSLNVLVELHGVLHCMDFRATAGYNLVIIDASGEGIYVYSPTDVSGYTTPQAGDSINVKGKIAQFNGLTQVRADEIDLLATGVATNTPIVTTALDETTENQYVTLENVTLVTPIATFPTTNSNLDVTDGTNTYQIRILTSTDLGGTPAPKGPFNVTGIGSQYDTSNPYDSGYQLLPCGTDAIEIVCAGANLPTVTTTTSGTTITLDSTAVSYQWVDCNDALISGATNQSYTATVTGEYAVIASNDHCSDTSSCVQITVVGLENIDLTNEIVAYPNPVNNELTIKNFGDSKVVATITDINGRVVSDEMTITSNVVVNTASWNSGVYFVNLKNEYNEIHTLKVVK